MNEQKQSNPYVIPLSIVISGVLIAGSIMYAGDGGSGTLAQVGGAVTGTNNAAQPDDPSAGALDALKPVSAEDKILGDPSAPVKIVEFSDLECPFCARFHTTMQQVMNEYGKDGRVAWVYRHFPLESIHPSARLGANGAECAGELGGPSKFWDFTNTVFERQSGGLSSAMFSQVANDIGIDNAAFSSCIESGRYDALIDQHIEDAIATGGRGTPYSIVVAADGRKSAINGADTFAVVKSKIEQALGN